MIHWLTQTQAEMPETARSWAHYLSETEQKMLASLRTEKRRQDWLLGRWTAKRLLQRVIWEASKVTVPLSLITIGNDAAGVPTYQSPVSNLQCSISISHGNGRALAAAVSRPAWPVGADLELIAPRSEQFVDDYFTETEALLVRQVSGEMRDILITAVWSAKEAVLKALHLGLSVDTRTVACLLEPLAQPPARWTRFVIRSDPKWQGTIGFLTGWWRVENGFVLTLAAG